VIVIAWYQTISEAQEGTAKIADTGTEQQSDEHQLGAVS